MKRNIMAIALVAVAFLAIGGCAVVNTISSINPIDIQTDKELGNQMYAQIASDSKSYPLLDEGKYATVYRHLNQIFSSILNTGVVAHRNDFDWTIKIIKADDELNAFACPGGKVYVYTGLIKFLDNEAQLAGVIAHEIAHCAARHSSRQIFQNKSIDYVKGMLLGKNSNELVGAIAQLAGSLGGLAFSRKDEYEADKLAVYYLSQTDYNPLGVAGFFEKLQAAGMGRQTAAFLSTHPSPPDRIQQIKSSWQEFGSKKGSDFVERYKQVKSSLQAK